MRGGWNQRAKTETLENNVVSDGVEGVRVDPIGECHHERGQVNISRRQSEAAGKEGEENKSPKRNPIPMECEETQDYVHTHTPCRTHTGLTDVRRTDLAHTHWLEVSAVRLSSLSIITFPPSLLLPRGHFDTSRLHLAELFPIRKRGSSALPADPTHSTSYEPKEFDKITSADGDTTLINDSDYENISDFSKITCENTGPFGVSTMLESSVSHVSHGESKDKHASGNRC